MFTYFVQNSYLTFLLFSSYSSGLKADACNDQYIYDKSYMIVSMCVILLTCLTYFFHFNPNVKFEF